MEPNFQTRGYDPNDWQRRRWERRARIRHTSMVPAIVLIAVGAIFFLNNLHIFILHDIWRYWPAILVAVGLIKLVDSPDHRGRTGGAILITIGGIFLLPNLGIWDISYGDLWPLILIGLGVVLLVQRVAFQGAWTHGPNWNAEPAAGIGQGVLREDAIFSGGKRKVVSPDFKGGEVSCIFGGFDIDLRKAGIAGDSAVLVVNAIFGGCDIKVPESWDVVMEISAIFGGCDDKTMHPDSSLPGVKRLYLRGSAVFGGIDVKN